MSKKLFSLTQEEMRNALAQYLHDHRNLKVLEGTLEYYTCKDGSVLIEIFEDEVRLH